tara:strand:- start:124 stop:303 length:180 start_codon:yes stop_codon:yes gene_type:complete
MNSDSECGYQALNSADQQKAPCPVIIFLTSSVFINITEKGIFTGGSIPLAYCGYQISSY